MVKKKAKKAARRKKASRRRKPAELQAHPVGYQAPPKSEFRKVAKKQEKEKEKFRDTLNERQAQINAGRPQRKAKSAK